MSELKEESTFSPENFVPQGAAEQNATPDTAVQTAAPVSPEIPEQPSNGSALAGIFGALAGALVGAVPWFLVSTFANFFVGWLGFLVGIAACYGYQLFKGKRSTRFAMFTVILASILALFAAEIASWMYLLCSDPEWQLDAMYWGIPVAKLAWESILMPENWGTIAPSLLLGMAIGILGVFSAKQSVLKYTDPEKAAKLQATAFSGAPAPLPDGFQLPQEFTVRETKSITAVGWVFVILFGLLGAMSLLLIGEEGMLFPIVTFGILTFAGVWFILRGKRHRLEVNGKTLRYVSTSGKVREFSVSDIRGMTSSNLNGKITLIGQGNEKLISLNRNMHNSDILLKYLAAQNIALIAK